MLALAQDAIKHPKVSNAFDWSVFAGGMASLVFAVAMTVVQHGDTRNAGTSTESEVTAAL